MNYCYENHYRKIASVQILADHVRFFLYDEYEVKRHNQDDSNRKNIKFAVYKTTKENVPEIIEHYYVSQCIALT